MAASHPTVLIIGAGPTGLTAALELSRRGIPPRIVDRKHGPTPLSRAVGISPHSLDLLEPSGVAHRLLAQGIQVRHGHIWYEGRELGMVDLSILMHRFNFLLSLPQRYTETVMAAALAERGVRVEWGTTVVGLTQSNGPVDVRLDSSFGQEQASFGIVFGADGVHSTVREAVGLSFEGHTHRRLWSISDVELAYWQYEAGSTQLFFHADGDVGFIIPIGPERYRIVSNTNDAVASVPGCYELLRALRSDTFRIPVRQAGSYQRGCGFLGGDAAHVQSPAGACGMNLGIEDAAAFAQRLTENRLDGYSLERRPVGRRWLRASERILAAAQARGLLAKAGRNLAFRAIGHLTSLQRPLLERFTGLRE